MGGKSLSLSLSLSKAGNSQLSDFSYSYPLLLTPTPNFRHRKVTDGVRSCGFHDDHARRRSPPQRVLIPLSQVMWFSRAGANPASGVPQAVLIPLSQVMWFSLGGELQAMAHAIMCLNPFESGHVVFTQVYGNVRR